jgi:hypothetical protein
MAEVLWLRGSSGADVVWVTLDAAAVDLLELTKKPIP